MCLINYWSADGNFRMNFFTHAPDYESRLLESVYDEALEEAIKLANKLKGGSHVQYIRIDHNSLPANSNNAPFNMRQGKKIKKITPEKYRSIVQDISGKRFY